MTLCVVSSNEDATPQDGIIHQQETVMGSRVDDEMRCSQDSGISSAPSVSTQIGTNLRITACANQGGRKYMEDRVHVHVERRADTGEIEWTYLAVYDGHGGPEASQYCRQWLLPNIRNQNGFDSENDDEFLEAIRNGFLHTHHQMWKEVDSWERTASGYASTAGTTASCAFIRRGKLYVGHVGDSAILLTTRSDPDRFYRLTEDHKPESAAERKRIEAAGGQVMQKSYVYRVVWTRPVNGQGPVRKTTPVQNIPFLAVARSLGDFWSYCEATQEFTVSPNPDVAVIELTADHHSIILASDGLTNVMSADLEAAIMYGLSSEEKEPRYFKDKNEQPNHARILMRRTMFNWRRFRADNVSVVAAILEDPSENCISSQSSLNDETDAPAAAAASAADPPVDVPLDTPIDMELSDHPLCMLHVTNDRTLRYQTAPVPMKYNGIFDNNFCSVSSVGPGFVTHEAEEEALAAAAATRLPSDSPHASDNEEDEDGVTSSAAALSPTLAAAAARLRRLEQFYDVLGLGDRDVTPENNPPPIGTRNLSNGGSGTTTNGTNGANGANGSTVGPALASKRRISIAPDFGANKYSKKANSVFGQRSKTLSVPGTDYSSSVFGPSIAAALIDELRRDGRAAADAAAAAASSAAAESAATGEEERPTTPPNKPEAGFAVLRSSRSSAKRKSRIVCTEETPEGTEASTSAEKEKEAEGSESESNNSPDREPTIMLSLPFVEEEEKKERTLRTPSPIGDADRGEAVRATPVCNSAVVEKEMMRRVTRSVAASNSAAGKREMVVVQRPATRRSAARQLLQDDEIAAAAASPAPVAAATSKTPKMVLQVEETIASRTRSRLEVTPPSTSPSSSSLSASSGSRKRPRSAMGSTATPLMAKISLIEMNENASTSGVSGESEKAGTPLKSGVTAALWHLPLPFESEEPEMADEAIDQYYEVNVAPFSSIDTSDSEPPSKRARIWNMIRKWWNGSESM